MSTYESAKGLEIMKEALSAIESRIEQYEGHFKINMQPKIVSEFDDAELARKMADLERINTEVEGDDDSEGLTEDSDDEEEDDDFNGEPYVEE